MSTVPVGMPTPGATQYADRGVAAAEHAQWRELHTWGRLGRLEFLARHLPLAPGEAGSRRQPEADAVQVIVVPRVQEVEVLLVVLR